MAKTASASVYQSLKEDILHGEFQPGERLVLDHLQDNYNVGATPLREALSALSSVGLVIHEDLKGFKVPEISSRGLYQLAQTKCWLDEIALRKSVERGDKVWEDQLILIHFRLSKTASINEDGTINREWEQVRMEFQNHLTSATGSPWLTQFCNQLDFQINRYLYYYFLNFPNHANITEILSALSHQELFEAAIERDTDQVVALHLDNFRRGVETIETALVNAGL